jgi:hypothetical protein
MVEKNIYSLFKADGWSQTNHNHSRFFYLLEHYGQQGYWSLYNCIKYKAAITWKPDESK